MHPMLMAQYAEARSVQLRSEATEQRRSRVIVRRLRRASQARRAAPRPRIAHA
jgi:hypothetical protein